MGRYDPQSLASTAGPHDESFSTLVWVAHWLSVQRATSCLPWQAVGVAHTGEVWYFAGQSVSLAQQSPELQQKPLAQWPDLQRSLSLSQACPLSRSPTQVLPTGSQYPSGSQSESVLQWVGQAGWVCAVPPLQ